MSNAVDILLVGGPSDGVVMCQPRPVPTTITHRDTEYTTLVHNQVYRVAYYSLDDVEDVPNAIVAAQFQPAWDLR
jgi:hypothetical protein